MPEKFLGNLLAMASMASWASGFVAVSFLLETWHPALLAPLRLFLAGLVPLTWLLLSRRGGELVKLPWGAIFLTGGICLGGSGLLIVWGQGLSDATTASIITTGMPLIAATMGLLAGEESFSWPLAGGVALALGGGVLAALATAESGPGFRGGEIVVLAAVTLFVLYSRGAVKNLAGLRDLPKSATTLIAGALTVAPLTFILVEAGAIDARYDFSPRSIGLILWMGPVAFALANMLWLRASRMLGVTIAGIHQNEIPFFVMLFLLAFGGKVEPFHVAAAVLVISGAWLAQRPAKKTKGQALGGPEKERAP